MTSHYKILMVDDDSENIRQMTECFEALCPDYILYQATSAKIALELVKTIKIDIVISDWEMPVMSGIDLLKAIKADSNTNHIPVIIVTGVMINEADLEIALSSGAHDYLRKPVERTELVARTNSAINFVKINLNKLAIKDVELVQKSLMLAKNNQFNIVLGKKLKQLISTIHESPEAIQLVNSMIKDIEMNTRVTNWDHFEFAFQNVYPEFSRNITKEFPDLTPGEIRHCMLIRLGMSNKDIASLLFQSPDSVKVTRSRIRRKLGINNDTNLQSFLMKF